MADPGDSDEALMARYARGDAAFFGVLYRRHEMRVWRYLERNVGNRATADELMQEVWFAVARDAPRYQASAKFTTWLFTIAHNRMIDAIRARRHPVSLDALGIEADSVIEHLTTDEADEPLAAADGSQKSIALMRAVSRLPREQRESFLLQVEGDLSVEEIADLTDSTFETVKSRLRYARSKLRELLQEYA